MLKLFKDQRGLAGVAEVGLVGLLLVVIVFAGTRVYNATRTADQANQEAIKVSETSPDFKEADTLQEEKKEDAKPKEEKKDEDPKPVATTDKPKPEETEPKKLKNINVNVSASQNSEAITVSATLGASYSGKCEIKLKKSSKIVKYDTVSNTSSCSATFDKDDISEDGDWYAYVYFKDNDKTVEGWGDDTINVTL